ncbi:hypothetical protein KEM55_001314 [Ascosphaera atra]|nr:hypothetical protein KEM55_001314 [Ascosphaera atra]
MQRAREARNDTNEQGTRSRGLGKDALGAHAKSSHIRLCFGPTSDLLPILIARESWMGHMDVTFPSKKTLKKALKEPREEYVACVYPEQYKAEATGGWDWYYGEPGERFRGKQKRRAVSKEEGRSYLPSPRPERLKVLIGPIGPQKVYETNVGDTFNFGEAFAKGTREGWILDAGNKVQCLSWCPNVAGDYQYLAVAAPVRDEQKRAQNEGPSETHSAFERTGLYPAAIQIWAFKAERKEGEGLARLDVAVKPRLVQVICTDAGNVRRLAWCPSPREWREADKGDAERTSLGLLGGVWSDGTVKVLDVKVRNDAKDTEYGELLSIPCF